MAEKKIIPIKFNVGETLWHRVCEVLGEEDITQSEYLRTLIKRDLKERLQKSLSSGLAAIDSDE